MVVFHNSQWKSLLSLGRIFTFAWTNSCTNSTRQQNRPAVPCHAVKTALLTHMEEGLNWKLKKSPNVTHFYFHFCKLASTRPVNCPMNINFTYNCRGAQKVNWIICSPLRAVVVSASRAFATEFQKKLESFLQGQHQFVRSKGYFNSQPIWANVSHIKK